MNATGEATKRVPVNPLWQWLATGAQAKLTVGAPDDPQEREADRLAEQVTGRRGRSGAAGSRCAPVDDAGSTRRKPAGDDSRAPVVTPRVEASIHALRGQGQPLPESTRAFFEPRLGMDLSGVRVHAHGAAADAARSIHARAFTAGSDVAFAAGEYAPDSEPGRRLMAHELVHVRQQGASQGTVRRDASDPAGNGVGDARLDENRALLGTWGIELDEADEQRLATDFPAGFHVGDGDLLLFVTTTAESAEGVRLRGLRIVDPAPLQAGVESYIFPVGKGRSILVSSVSGAGSVILDLGVDQAGRTSGVGRLLNSVLALSASGAATLPIRALLSHTDADHLNAASAFLSHSAFRGTTLEVAREQLRSAVGQADWTAMRLNLVPSSQVVEIEVTGTAAAGSRVGPAGAQVHVRKQIIGDFELIEFRSVEAHRRMMDPSRRTFDKNSTSPVTVITDLVTGDRFLVTADARLRQFPEIVNAIGEAAFLRILGAQGRNLQLFEPPHHGGKVQGPDVAGMISALRLTYEAGGGAARLVMQTSESFIAPGGPSSFRFLEAAGVELDPVLADPSTGGTYQATRARGGALERVTFDTTGIQGVMALVRSQVPVLDAAYARLGEIRDLQTSARQMHEGLVLAGAPEPLLRSMEQIRAELAARERAFAVAANPVWTAMQTASSGEAGMRDSRDLSRVSARLAALATHARGIDLTNVRESLSTHEAGMSAYARVFTTLVSMMNALRFRDYQELHRLRGEYDASLRALRGIVGRRVVAEHVRATWKSIRATWSPERIHIIARRLGSHARVQRIMETHYRVELLESLTRQAQLNEMVERASSSGRQSYGPRGAPQMSARTRGGAGFLIALEGIRLGLDFWASHKAAEAAEAARDAADRKEGFQTVRWWVSRGAHPTVALVEGSSIISDALPQAEVLDVVAGKKTQDVPEYDKAVVVDVPVDDLMFLVHAYVLEAQSLQDWHELNDANPSGGPTFKRFGEGWGVRLWSRDDHRYKYFSIDEIQDPLDALLQRLEAGQQQELEKVVDASDGMVLGQQNTAWFFGSDRYAFVFNQSARRKRIDFGGTNPSWVQLGEQELDGEIYALVRAVDLPTYKELVEHYWRSNPNLHMGAHGNFYTYQVSRNVQGLALVDPDDLTFRPAATVSHAIRKTQT